MKWTPLDWSYFIKRVGATAVDAKISFVKLIEMGEQEYEQGPVEAANKVRKQLTIQLRSILSKEQGL